MKFVGEMGVQFKGDLSMLDSRVDRLMEQLLDIEETDPDIEDPDITATLACGEVQVSMFIDAGDLAEAAQKLIVTVRHAIHAIGDGTPGWERIAREVRERDISLRPVHDRELADAL